MSNLMECLKDKLYFLVETLRRNNRKATEIHEFLQNAWPEDCLSVRQIQRLCKEYEDDFDNIDDVKKFLETKFRKFSQRRMQVALEGMIFDMQKIADIGRSYL